MILFRNDPFVKFVDEFFDSRTDKTQSGYVNVYKKQDENEYTLDFIVPGLTKNDINIIVEEDLLKITYTKSDNEKTFIDSFERTYTLPEDVNDKKISAKVQNGILKISIPKTKKKNSQRTISIG
jgi:HSP20 family protein